MNKIEAFDILWSSLKRNVWINKHQFMGRKLADEHPPRRLLAKCVAMDAMIDLSGCEYPEEALFAQREKEIKEFQKLYVSLGL